jgi:hypothetical protein
MEAAPLNLSMGAAPVTQTAFFYFKKREKYSASIKK